LIVHAHRIEQFNNRRINHRTSLRYEALAGRCLARRAAKPRPRGIAVWKLDPRSAAG
jgi:hypothetical protein